MCFTSPHQKKLNLKFTFSDRGCQPETVAPTDPSWASSTEGTAGRDSPACLIYIFIRAEMIAEEVQDVFVERTVLVKQEAIARRNYKLVNWLKLLSLHEQDNNHQAIDDVIRQQIHENFVMQEHFWLAECKKRLAKKQLSRADIQLVLLALEDGHYLQVATLIAETVVKMYKAKTLRESFVLSVLEKCVALFEYGSNAAPFFRLIRQIYGQKNNVMKIRSSFERELRLAHDNFDLVWDEYKLWEPEPSLLEKNGELYLKSKARWEKQAEEFDDNLCSEMNVKQSLINLESLNESRVDEKAYLSWVEKLPSEGDKVWFLRRMVLNYRQLFKPYLLKLEQLHSSDEEVLIKKYQVAIRLSDHSRQIQFKYLCFLTRRINRHLLNQPLPESYNEGWAAKVGFFRDEITALIEKPRVGSPPEEMQQIFRDYYSFWIEVEVRAVRDKEAVCQLFEKLIRETGQMERYQDYGCSLLLLGAVKQAKNVLKRYIFHANNQQSKDKYLKFIQIYGNIEDQVQFYSDDQQDPSLKKRNIEKEREQDSTKTKENPVESAEPKIEPLPNQENQLKRERPAEPHDQTEAKIYESTRKKLHIDGDFTVYLKGIPTVWSQSDVLKVLVYPEEVIRVGLVVKNNEQRDYCYIEFKSKEAAQKQVKDNKSPYKLYISKPPSEYDQSSTLFVCALPATVDTDKIKEIFGEHRTSITDVRLKLDREKNYAYVEFGSVKEKDEAFEQAKKHPLVIDGKKIIVQHCDSSRAKNKKLLPVVFLKNLAFKAGVKDIQQFFEGKELIHVQIPVSRDKGKPQGFAYVQFAKFKDYQDALDMRTGTLFGREFQILRSDRQINFRDEHQSNREGHQVNSSEDHRTSREGHHDGQTQEGGRARHKPGRRERTKQKEELDVKTNSYFSNLFK